MQIYMLLNGRNFVRSAYIFIPVFLILILASFNQKIYAANNSGTSLTSSPIYVDLSARPGGSVTTDLSIMNNGPFALPVAVRLDEFKARGDLGQASIYPPTKNDVTASWVKFSQTSLVAQPQVWETVKMMVNLPKTAELGYYYAVLFAPKPAIPGLQNNGNTLKSANAIFVLVNALSPNAKPSLEIDKFISLKSSYQYLPATLNVTVHNNGNIFLIPSGDIFISRTLNGKSIDVIPFNPGIGNVLPGTDRIFQSQWSDGFPTYQIKRIDGQVVSNKSGQPDEYLNWNFSKLTSFRFGRYYAKFVMVYNDGIRDVPVTAVVSFWVIPWFLLAIIFIVTLLVLFGVWSIARIAVKAVRKPKRRFVR